MSDFWRRFAARYARAKLALSRWGFAPYPGARFAAALVLADNPGLTPDQVKARLLGNTDPGPVGNPFVDGHGALDADAAATAGPMNYNQSALLLRPALVGSTVNLSPAGPADTWN